MTYIQKVLTHPDCDSVVRQWFQVGQMRGTLRHSVQLIDGCPQPCSEILYTEQRKIYTPHYDWKAFLWQGVVIWKIWYSKITRKQYKWTFTITFQKLHPMGFRLNHMHHYTLPSQHFLFLWQHVGLYLCLYQDIQNHCLHAGSPLPGTLQN